MAVLILIILGSNLKIFINAIKLGMVIINC